jgi:hypothetical protein
MEAAYDVGTSWAWSCTAAGLPVQMTEDGRRLRDGEDHQQPAGTASGPRHRPKIETLLSRYRPVGNATRHAVSVIAFAGPR